MFESDRKKRYYYPMNERQDFARFVKTTRKSLEIQQADFEGVSQGAICKIEKGLADCSLKNEVPTHIYVSNA